MNELMSNKICCWGFKKECWVIEIHFLRVIMTNIVNGQYDWDDNISNFSSISLISLLVIYQIVDENKRI